MKGKVLDSIKETILMKKIVFIFLLAFTHTSIFAECAWSGMQFFPQQSEISLNSQFIIQGYGESQKTVNSFKNRKVYLESESGALIELNLQEILQGQMQLTQALFCPTSELKPNTKYFLKYTDQTENESREMMQFNREKEISEKVYWTTTNEKTLESPNNLNISFKKTEVIQYGCGPSAYAIFDVDNDAESEIWFKTEVVDLTTNNKAVYYIREQEGSLNVGHGMCEGAFTYEREGKYKVRFMPMNTDGKTLKTTEWTIFESPFMHS